MTPKEFKSTVESQVKIGIEYDFRIFNEEIHIVSNQNKSISLCRKRNNDPYHPRIDFRKHRDRICEKCKEEFKRREEK
jgi:hypothetical protein